MPSKITKTKAYGVASLPGLGEGSGRPGVMPNEDHPAKFSKSILEVIRELLVDVSGDVLDPFAGVGGVHFLARTGLRTFGVELEREWAACHQNTKVGDATKLRYKDDRFDAVVTSPCYGNRMADHHVAKDPCKACEGKGRVRGKVGGSVVCVSCKGTKLSRRHTYTHRLGRKLTEGNSGAMAWDTPAYRALHRKAWAEVHRVLKPGGLFVLNISDHLRDGVRQPVTAQHLEVVLGTSLKLIEIVPVATPRNRQGANAGQRVDGELVLVFKKLFP